MSIPRECSRQAASRSRPWSRRCGHAGLPTGKSQAARPTEDGGCVPSPRARRRNARSERHKSPRA
eukprot:scaffold9409_cov116-Isochrysis_galbana.AAC.13